MNGMIVSLQQVLKTIRFEMLSETYELSMEHMIDIAIKCKDVREHHATNLANLVKCDAIFCMDFDGFCLFYEITPENINEDGRSTIEYILNILK